MKATATTPKRFFRHGLNVQQLSHLLFQDEPILAVSSLSEDFTFSFDIQEQHLRNDRVYEAHLHSLCMRLLYLAGMHYGADQESRQLNYSFVNLCAVNQHYNTVIIEIDELSNASGVLFLEAYCYTTSNLLIGKAQCTMVRA